MKLKTLLPLLGFATTLFFTLGASAYALQLSQTESISFYIATPAGNVTDARVVKGTGPPISMAPIALDLDQRGILKKLIQPDLQSIGTKNIYNLGEKPVRIRLELLDCGIPVKWNVKSGIPYDKETHTFTAPLAPGKSIPGLSIEWIFSIPGDDPSFIVKPNGAVVVYHGGLRVTDADTGETLTFIPITIGRGTTTVGVESCCS